VASGNLVIPSKYASLASVVDSIVERETGSLRQDVMSYYAERLGASARHDDMARVVLWAKRDDQQKDRERRLEAARSDTVDRLHQALVDDVLKAVVLTTMGVIIPLPVEFWRSQFGRDAFISDSVKWWQSAEFSTISLEGRPLIERQEFDRWNNVNATAGDERRLKRWLVQQMIKSPNEPRSKAVMTDEARRAGLRFTLTMFDRVWPDAAKDANAPKWSEPGRRSKIPTN
jgi:uncharacterized protein with von Willebrand factor type A (vWA) domain